MSDRRRLASCCDSAARSLRVVAVLSALAVSLEANGTPAWTHLFDFTSDSRDQYGYVYSSMVRLASDGKGGSMVAAGYASSGWITGGDHSAARAIPPSDPLGYIDARRFSDTGESLPCGSLWYQSMLMVLREPDIATDTSGIWAAMWTHDEGQVLVTRMNTNVSSTWDTTQPLCGTGSTPRIATDRLATWLAVCQTYGGTGDRDLLFSRSTDNGSTWSALQVLNSNASTDSESDAAPDIAADGNGNWVVAWHAGPTGNTRLLYTRSTDNGTTWQAVAPLSSNPITSSSNEQNPEIATDGSGVWIATWRSNSTLGGALGPGYHALFSRSMDNGATWSPAAAVSSHVAADSPVIACRNGRWIILWGGRCATSTDAGLTWTIANSPSQGPVVAIQPAQADDEWIAVRYDCVFDDPMNGYYLYNYTVHALDESAQASHWEFYE